MTESIHYRLRFPNVRQHVVDVEAFFPTSYHAKIRPQLFVKLPVWTPGSYLVREYARNIESIAAFDADTGERLTLAKLSKNRWSIDCLGSRTVCVRYSLYCREASVRTNWIEEDYGFLTGAATFLTLDDDLTREHIIDIEPPATWPSIACSLPRADKTVDETANDDESANSIWKCFSRRANSFDELVDSPMLMGDLAIQTFHVSGICHYLACYGTDETWDLNQATRDCAKIVAVQHAFWGEIPYPSYWFINMALESYGGLEHDNNTVLFTSRWAMRKRTTYLEWLGLVSHEFFHAWNVRRLRPKNLICYDYGAEQYTPELWIAEGITSYFDDLFVLRAGLLAQDEYLGMLGKLIQQVDDAPGSLVQTLKDASFDTWIKHYRPDENSINSRVSYYTKGALVAFLLDIHLRMLSDDRSSLGDLMRELWKRFLVSGYTLSDFESVASELAGSDLSAWFERYVHRSEALDYRQALDWLGLEIVSTNIAAPQNSTSPPVATEKMTDGSESEWELGCETTYRDGRIIVTRIVRGSSASIAGLQVDDELIAFSGHRLPKENWKDRLQYYRPGQELFAMIARRGRLREIRLHLQPRNSRKLAWVGEPTAIQTRHREAWLFE